MPDFPKPNDYANLKVNQNLIYGDVSLDHHAATKWYVDKKIDDLISTAPSTLDTLKEIVDFIGDENVSLKIVTRLSAAESSREEISNELHSEISKVIGRIDTVSGELFTEISGVESRLDSLSAELSNTTHDLRTEIEQVSSNLSTEVGVLEGKISELSSNVTVQIDGEVEELETALSTGLAGKLDDGKVNINISTSESKQIQLVFKCSNLNVTNSDYDSLTTFIENLKGSRDDLSYDTIQKNDDTINIHSIMVILVEERGINYYYLKHYLNPIEFVDKIKAYYVDELGGSTDVDIHLQSIDRDILNIQKTMLTELLNENPISTYFDPLGINVKTSANDHILVGTDGGILKVFEKNTGNEVQTFNLPTTDHVYISECSPNGKYIVYGTHDGSSSITLIDYESKNVIFTESYVDSNNQPTDVYGLSWSSDDTKIAIGLSDGRVMIWDLSPLMGYTQEIQNNEYVIKTELQNRQSNEEVWTVDFFSNGGLSYVVSANNNGGIKIWDLSINLLSHEIPNAHSGGINSIKVSHDGTYMVSGGYNDYKVKLWNITDINTPTLVSTMDKHTGSIYDVSFSNDDKYIVSGGTDGMIYKWSIDYPNEIVLFSGGHEEVYSVTFSSDDTQIISGGYHTNGTIIWDSTNGNVISTITENTWVNSASIMNTKTVILQVDNPSVSDYNDFMSYFDIINQYLSTYLDLTLDTVFTVNGVVHQTTPSNLAFTTEFTPLNQNSLVFSLDSYNGLDVGQEDILNVDFNFKIKDEIFHSESIENIVINKPTDGKIVSDNSTVSGTIDSTPSYAYTIGNDTITSSDYVYKENNVWKFNVGEFSNYFRNSNLFVDSVTLDFINITYTIKYENENYNVSDGASIFNNPSTLDLFNENVIQLSVKYTVNDGTDIIMDSESFVYDSNNSTWQFQVENYNQVMNVGDEHILKNINFELQIDGQTFKTISDFGDITVQRPTDGINFDFSTQYELSFQLLPFNIEVNNDFRTFTRYEKRKEDGNFQISETGAYMYIGDHWRISASNTPGLKQLNFEYNELSPTNTEYNTSWKIGIPFFNSTPY